MSQFAGTEVTAEVLRAACDGDARAQEAIYRSYQRPVYSLIRRLIARPAIADELFQETFVEVLRKSAQLLGRGCVRRLGARIAVNKCLMYLRSPWHRSLLYLDADENEPIADVLIDAGVGSGCASAGQQPTSSVHWRRCRRSRAAWSGCTTSKVTHTGKSHA